MRPASHQGSCASVFYSWFAALGVDMTVEDSTAHARVDMAVRINRNVYLFEFKALESSPPGAAMEQLEARGYADKHRHRGEAIWPVAVEFGKEARNLAAFEVERT